MRVEEINEAMFSRFSVEWGYEPGDFEIENELNGMIEAIVEGLVDGYSIAFVDCDYQDEQKVSVYSLEFEEGIDWDDMYELATRLLHWTREKWIDPIRDLAWVDVVEGSDEIVIIKYPLRFDLED